MSNPDQKEVVREQKSTVAATIVPQPTAKGRERFLFNLFDRRFVGVVTRHGEPGADSRTWSGSLEKAAGTFTLLEYQGRKFLNVHAGKRIFEVVPSESDNVTVREVDPNQVPECQAGRFTSEDATSTINPCLAASAAVRPISRAVCVTDDRGPTKNIDALVVYPTTLAVFSPSTVEAFILMSVDETNQAFENSAVNAHLRIGRDRKQAGGPPCMFAVNHVETTDVAQVLDNLIKSSDGVLDNVHTMREDCRADVVLLMVSQGNGGMACIMESLNSAFAPYAFGVVTEKGARYNYEFAHEVGHLMGAGHDIENGLIRMCEDSAGWRYRRDWLRYKTVMAYRPGLPSPQFSNPDIGAGLTSEATGKRNVANNARTLRISAETVSKFRLP
jgi:hypothetical protein